jgi:hypothetical protein
VKSAILLLFICFTFKILQAQLPTGIDDTINSIKGRWAKTDLKYSGINYSVSSKELPSVLKEMEKLYALANKLYPEPKGMEIRFHRYIGSKPIVNNGPAAYNVWTQIFFYYYNVNNKKILLQIESGEGFSISGNMFSGNGIFIEEKNLIINGRQVYQMPGISTPLKGMKVYKDFYGRDANSQHILITKESSQLLIPVTQKEYLTWLKIHFEKSKQEFLVSEMKRKYRTPEEDEALKQKVLQDIDKNSPPQKKEAAKATYQKNFVTGEQERQKNIERVSKINDDLIKRIDDYMADTLLNNIYQPALTSDYYDFDKPQKRLSGNELVFLNPNYFDLKKPRHLPQFFVVSWNIAGTGTPSHIFKKHFEEDFDFDTLKKMLDEK